MKYIEYVNYTEKYFFQYMKEKRKNNLQLYDISLANNRICQIHKSAFDGVKHSIQTINLGRNCLKKVPASGKLLVL